MASYLLRGFAIAALVALTAGCTTAYHKAGVSDAQRRRDEAACTHRSVDRIPGGLMGDRYFVVERVDRACMERRGYRLQ
jgi:hypothetical protein